MAQPPLNLDGALPASGEELSAALDGAIGNDIDFLTFLFERCRMVSDRDTLTGLPPTGKPVIDNGRPVSRRVVGPSDVRNRWRHIIERIARPD